jgi:hypothetical protein
MLQFRHFGNGRIRIDKGAGQEYRWGRVGLIRLLYQREGPLWLYNDQSGSCHTVVGLVGVVAVLVVVTFFVVGVVMFFVF